MEGINSSIAGSSFWGVTTCGVSSTTGYSIGISAGISDGASSATEYCLGISAAAAASASSSSVSSSAVDSSSAEKLSSLKSTPSLSTTVSNCENGLFTNSFIEASGVKVILSWPSMSTRSPVLTLMLSRASMSIILNVPSPFTFTKRSVSKASFTTSKSVMAKRSASFFFRPLLAVRTAAISCIDLRSISLRSSVL